MATKYSTDFRTFHLAVLHLHTVEVGFRMNRYAVRGVMGERQWSGLGLFSLCGRFRSLIAKNSSLCGHVSFLLGAILHCAAILFISDVWILMFVVHFLTRESIFLFHFVLWLGKLQMLFMCLAPLSRLDEAVALIELYHIVNPEAKSVTAKYEPGQKHKFIQVMLFVVHFKFWVLGFSFQMWFVRDCLHV